MLLQLAAEGDAEGAVEGTAEGANEGEEVGTAEGVLEGEVDGAVEGATEGDTDGAAEGELEGTVLGESVIAIISSTTNTWKPGTAGTHALVLAAISAKTVALGAPSSSNEVLASRATME